MEQKYEVTVDEEGEFWRQNGLLHRVDGPAVIYTDGSQAWWQNGKLHRVNGPAVIYADGDQEWWQNGKRHRIDGPAIIRENGDQFWYIDGKEFTKEEFNRRSALCASREVIVDGVTHRLTPK